MSLKRSQGAFLPPFKDTIHLTQILMKTRSDAQKFAYVTIALLSLISAIGKTPTTKDLRIAISLILSTEDLIRNYDFVLQAKNHLESAFQSDYESASEEVYSMLRTIKLRRDLAALAVDIGFKYLRRAESDSPEKRAVLEHSAQLLKVIL